MNEASSANKWSTEFKVKMDHLFSSQDYQSSEESDPETGEITVFPLSWLRKRYSKAMHVIDKLAFAKSSTRGRLQRRKRLKSCMQSMRSQPPSAPVWALKMSPATTTAHLDDSGLSLDDSELQSPDNNELPN